MEKETLCVNSIVKRLKSETPRFWKKIRNIMLVCGTVGGALLSVPVEYTIQIYKIVPEHLAGTLFTIGAVGTALASLTKTDTPQ